LILNIRINIKSQLEIYFQPTPVSTGVFNLLL
jgi:hypothetical protein